MCGNRCCYTTARRHGPSLAAIATAFSRPVSLDEVSVLAADGDVIVRRWLTDLGRSMA
ncbi:hypothetical protein ACWD62_13600 [Streptomyces sp. NPDC005146]